MKTLSLIIVITVILTLVCSPALAISKADLISQYAGQSSPTILPPIPTPSHLPSWYITPTPTPVWGPVIPFPTPTPAPTQVPTGSGTGTLLVTSDPLGAMVYLDGNFKGMTPVTLSSISVGTHQVRVARMGYKEYSTSVSVTSGTTSNISVLLNAVSGPSTTPTPVWGPLIPFPTPTPTQTQVPTGSGTGTLLITSDPLGANVYLDGEYKGETPQGYHSVFANHDPDNIFILTGIPVGPHQVTFTKEGYKDYSTSVTLKNGEYKYVPAILVRISPDDPTSPNPTPTDLYEDMIFSDVRKPNIYLYSDRDLTARVRLSPERAITVSEPVYLPGKGWLAQIRDGSLNGAGDFLFYEATVPDSVWQKKEGFVIYAASREQDMAFMLGEYGFNEKETRDFIDYWAKYLSGDGDYVFYPQETSAVDRVMPLSIIPEPDHVSRIWFYAEPFVSAPDPVTNPEQIVRKGFCVVEWGVVI